MRKVYAQRTESNRAYNTPQMLNIINDTLANDTYDAVLSLIEFFCNELDEVEKIKVKQWNYEEPEESIFEAFNKEFEKEYVAYRFVNKKIRCLTDPIEIAAIEAAAKITANKVDEHINKALNFLSDRNNPDYENSIKESISAVEAMCNCIAGENTSLGSTLKHLEKNGVIIHPALKEAFDKLYGYTSDASGIRHSGQIGGSSSTFEEAEFMLVACSAFINYLKGLLSKTSED